MAYLRPLGIRKTTASTPISLYPTASKPLSVNGVYIQVLPSNTQGVYLLSNSSAADTTNYSNVLLVINNGGDVFADLSKFLNDIDLNTVYIAPMVDNEGAIVTVRMA